jgi:hypothetical protein
MELLVFAYTTRAALRAAAVERVKLLLSLEGDKDWD